MTNNAPMPKKDRCRRVILLCCSFARNLAYYRIGQRKEYKPLFDHAKNANANFWCTANGNFIDMCVLEWCKLFAERQGKHYWRKIVSDAAGFEAGLLHHLGLDMGAFQKEIDIMRRYRDTYIAHLDSDYIIDVPTLDVAKKAVWFYHAHIVSHEAKPRDLAGLPVEIDRGYEETEAEARVVYQLAGENCSALTYKL